MSATAALRQRRVRTRRGNRGESGVTVSLSALWCDGATIALPYAHSFDAATPGWRMEIMAQQNGFDVVVAGGGLAGLTLARQLRREHPELTVAVVERTTRPLDEGCHKVGESSVELGSQYLERLGLGDYLRERHLIKFGLRFFPGGGALPIEQRCELGPSQEPIIRSYQIDRGRFENDLRDMIADDGVTLIEGAVVREVELSTDGGEHKATVHVGDETRQLSARWLVDATGRNALFKRRMKLKRGTRHVGNAGWFRVKGRVDLAEMVPADASEWHDHSFASERWRSTNHLMGTGYWVWLIPLSSGLTSVGVVTHDSHHGFERVRSLENTLAFIAEHEPILAQRLADSEVLDFACLSSYSHGVARSWSDQRWAITGEAGAFIDPLYSPGTDYIAFTNSFTSELIRVDLAGEDLTTRVRQLNLQYRALVAGGVSVFRESAAVYGHARAMAAKIYFDNFSYWSFPCQYYAQSIYRVTGTLHNTLTMVGARFVELSGYVQLLMRAWAEQFPEEPTAGFTGLPAFPSLVIDTHLALADTMSPEETLAYFEMRVEQSEAMARELVIRGLVEWGPIGGASVLEQAEFSSWTLSIPMSRLDAEGTIGLARRRALDVVARDVERNLGRVTQHPQWREALDLVRPVAS
ncbi:MAG: flavin-dependent dehydrogenase [Myxococcota bacterium]|jgi:flavin-dependent dehydrogenase